MKIKKEDLEKEFDVINTKVKRESHPNEKNYPGRNGYEHKKAMFEYMSKLNKDQLELLRQKRFLFNKEESQNLLSEIKQNDFVGIKDTIYKVVSKTDKGFGGVVITNLKKQVFDGTEKEINISLEDIDFGLATKFAEILYRDNIPFGVSEEEDVQILIKKEKPLITAIEETVLNQESITKEKE